MIVFGIRLLTHMLECMFFNIRINILISRLSFNAVKQIAHCIYIDHSDGMMNIPSEYLF